MLNESEPGNAEFSSALGEWDKSLVKGGDEIVLPLVEE